MIIDLIAAAWLFEALAKFDANDYNHMFTALLIGGLILQVNRRR